MSDHCFLCKDPIPSEKLEESTDADGITTCEMCRKEAAIATIPTEVRLQIDGAIQLEKMYNWWVSPHELLGDFSPARLWENGEREKVVAFIESAKSGDMC